MHEQFQQYGITIVNIQCKCIKTYICTAHCNYHTCVYAPVALTLDDSVLTSHKTKVVTSSGSKPTLGFHTPTDDHSRSPRALRFVHMLVLHGFYLSVIRIQ